MKEPSRETPQETGPPLTPNRRDTILNTEVENSIIMEGAHIDCGKGITDSLIGRRVQILHDNSLPRGHRLILSDRSTITL
jgi:NDP-sugar pyrophosphorylase family protein